MLLAVVVHHGPMDQLGQRWLNGGAVAWPWMVELLGQLGLGATQWLLLTVLLLPRAPQAWAVFSLSLLVCGVSVQLAKFVLDLPRPLAVLPADTVQVLGDALRRRALPSGHTASAFALVGAMVGLRWRAKWLVMAALMALAIGWSRVAAGAHWPSDVLAGAALGLVCGQVCARSTKVPRLAAWAVRPQARWALVGLAGLAMASLLAEAWRQPSLGPGLGMGLMAGVTVLWQIGMPQTHRTSP